MLAPANTETMDRALSCLSLAGNDICSRGEISGLTALCKMLETNSSVRELKCASALRMRHSRAIMLGLAAPNAETL